MSFVAGFVSRLFCFKGCDPIRLASLVRIAFCTLVTTEKLLYTTYLLHPRGAVSRRRGEMSELAEGARLEIVYTSKAYLGFESPSLRHFT